MISMRTTLGPWPRHVRRPLRHLLRSGLCAAALLVLHPPAARAADYLLQPGDVVEVAVAGLPDLIRRVAVQLDGSLPLPLAGRVVAAGATLAEVEARIQTALASKALRIYAPDGREQLRFIEREQISAAIVEYRPISVTGEVARAGELPFRPRMTVRHLIASAGGIGRVETGALGAAAQLRGEYAALWVGLATELVRVWRLRAELGEEGLFDRSTLPPSPLPDRILDQLLAREAEFRRTRALNHAREKAYLAGAAAEAERQISALTAQNAREEEGVTADTAELERTVQLLNRGMVTQSRVIDARRVLLFSSTRALQTAAQLASVRRQRGELLRDAERADDLQRVRILAELQEAMPRAASARARLQSVEERLTLLGAPVPTGEGSELLVTLVRTGERGPVMMLADLDTELQPGDTVDVARRTGDAPAETVAERRPEPRPAVPPPVGAPVLAPAPAAAQPVVASLPAPPAGEDAAVAMLIQRGQSLLALGDISGARRFFERAAHAGSGQAALAAGGTHDPAVLARLNARSIRPDPAAAAAWYRRAADLGEAEAATRLAALPSGTTR